VQDLGDGCTLRVLVPLGGAESASTASARRDPSAGSTRLRRGVRGHQSVAGILSGVAARGRQYVRSATSSRWGPPTRRLPPPDRGRGPTPSVGRVCGWPGGEGAGSEVWREARDGP
jgi:hypothetical protein